MDYDWTKLPTPSKADVNLEHELAKNEVSKDPDALFGTSPTSSSDDCRFASVCVVVTANFLAGVLLCVCNIFAVLTSCLRGMKV